MLIADEAWPGRSDALLVGLAAERAALLQDGLTTGRLAQNGVAVVALDGGRGVAVHDVDAGAADALDVHEEGVGALHEALLLVDGALALDRREAVAGSL